MNTEAIMQEYQTVNLSQLTESLTNPRKTFDPVALNELAASIRAVGLLQPILVRPTVTEGSFEIVAGARRYRAAQHAGIDTVPIRVCQLTDAQVLEAQVIENLIRAEVLPYEETQGFLALMRLDPVRYTAQELAAKTGKSVTFVVSRLKLADLIPVAVESLQKDEIGIAHALLLARLSTAQQEEALAHCFTETWQCGKMAKRLVTVADLNHYIEQNITLELAEAPFNREDATLFSEAGACLNCPKRSGYNTLLFPDVKNDSCFDGACYREKVTRYIDTCNLVQLAGDYRPVPEGSPAVPRNRYTVLGNKPENQCSHAVQGIVSTGYNIGSVEYVCMASDCEKHSRQSTLPQDIEDATGLDDIHEHRRREAAIAEETAAQLRKEFTKKISAIPTPKEMNLLACMVAQAAEDCADEFLTLWGVTPPDEQTNMTCGEAVDQLLAHLASLSGKPLTAAIFEMLLFVGGCNAYNYRQSSTVAKAAQLYRVNVENVEKRVRRKVEIEAQQAEDEAIADAEKQPVDSTEAAQDDDNEPAEASPEPPKARSREGKANPNKVAATTSTAKTTKKLTEKA